MPPDTSRRAQADFTLLSISLMVKLMANRAQIGESTLERRFREGARGFAQTKSLLKSLRVLETEGQFVKPSPNLTELFDAMGIGEDVFARLLVRLIERSRGQFGEELRRIFAAFRLERGEPALWVAAFPDERFAMRNLLIELGVIHVDHGKERYLIGSRFFDTFIQSRYSRGVSPKALASDLMRKDELGLRTEKRVVETEKDIVGEVHGQMVRHVSLENSAAGFDIASVRVNENTGHCCLRLIEVKAVSPKDWRFTFTMNEIRTATENKDAYFLYLVPIVQGEPNVGGMVVLRDPIDTLSNSAGWIIQHGDWKVRKAV